MPFPQASRGPIPGCHLEIVYTARLFWAGLGTAGVSVRRGSITAAKGLPVVNGGEPMIPAILVLGCGVTRDGLPGDAFQDRLNMSLDIIERFGVSLAIIAGRGCSPEDRKTPNPPGRTEADIGARYLYKRGLDRRSVLLLKETLSMETLGNYIFATSAFLEPLRVSKVVTVTSPGHSNRCHQYASHLWATLPPDRRIEHVVVHGGQLSRSTELEELAQSDFVWDFKLSSIASLQDALDWIRRRHGKCSGYPETLDSANRDLQYQLDQQAGLADVVKLLRQPNSGVRVWVDRFTAPHEIQRRRRMYRVFVEEERRQANAPEQEGWQARDVITRDDCLSVFQLIGEFGLAIDNGVAPQVAQLLVHHIPIKFKRILEGRLPFGEQDPKLRRGFMKMVSLAVDYVRGQQHRQVVEIRAGQGDEAHIPFPITDGDMEKMKAEADVWIAQGAR